MGLLGGILGGVTPLGFLGSAAGSGKVNDPNLGIGKMDFWNNPYAGYGEDLPNKIKEAQAGTDQQLNGIFSNDQLLRQQLTNQLSGNAPSPGFQNALNQNIANEQSLIGSTKGLNPALAARMATDEGSKERQQAVTQSQMAALNGLMGLNQSQGQLALGQGELGQRGILGVGQIGAGAQAQNTAFGQGVAGGLLGGLGSSLAGVASGGGGAHGGVVQHFAGGGNAFMPDTTWMALQSPEVQNPYVANAYKAGENVFGPTLTKLIKGQKSPLGSDVGIPDVDTGTLGGQAAAGVPAALPMMASGGSIDPDGTDDSTANDVVDAKLSPGEIVLPRSITNSPNAAERAKTFVEALKKHTGKASYAKVVAARKKANED